jgi:membrane protein involved in colicin uptake
MRSQLLPGSESRQRAEERFKTTKKVNSETKANTTPRQAEAEKTARLRALRLAREAADKDTADRDAAAAKARRSESSRRVPGPQASSPSEPK